jgi:hypothetical protein
MKSKRSSTAWITLAITLAVAPGASALTQEPCCHVAAGTPVEVELVDQVSTKTAHTGDTFALRLAAPLIVDGQVVLRAGAPGVGEVVEASGRGMGGKGAKLVLAARYVGSGQARTPLQGLQLAAGGHDNTTAAQVVGLSGIAFGPLGLIGLAVPGGNVTFAAGTRAVAAVPTDVELPPLGRATRDELLAANDAVSAQEANAATGAIEVAPPPAGEGQIVFFRRKSLLGTGQWFKVRENGAALGKLNNGAYFVDVTDPGRHTFTATMEPELKDHLTLEVAPGQTYFVEGTLTKALVVGAADLTPSDRATFDRVSAKLKAARSGAEVETAAARDGAIDASAERAPDPNAPASNAAPDRPTPPS